MYYATLATRIELRISLSRFLKCFRKLMTNWNVLKFEMRRARGLVERNNCTKSVRKKERTSDRRWRQMIDSLSNLWKRWTVARAPASWFSARLGMGWWPYSITNLERHSQFSCWCGNVPWVWECEHSIPTQTDWRFAGESSYCTRWTDSWRSAASDVSL